MGKMRNREASQGRLPRMQNSFAQPQATCPRRQVPWCGPPRRRDAPASVTRELHKVPLSLASSLQALGPALTLFMALACEPFPSPVGSRVRPGVFVTAQGAEWQLRRAGSLAVPSLCRGIGFAWARVLRTMPSTCQLSFADRTNPNLI